MTAWRGRPDDPVWVRPALVALLVLTGAAYLWNLSASGWSNAYYAAAIQAGSQSWKAFLFGSFDASNAITVDKPPLSLWPMALSVRVFGLSSTSMLAPQALMGVATVGVLYATVRRAFGPLAGLLSGLALAVTPVATLMFRVNNPDALLTLLMTLAAATALRAVQDGRARWFAATGALIGFGFLTKQLQVLLVVPGMAAAHLLVGAAPLRRRVADLALAGACLVVAAGWWVAVVELWSEDSRPYIGGSQGNSVIELTLGYNGFGRLTGNETGSVGGGPAGAQPGFGGPVGPGVGVGRPAGPRWGETGITRMVDGEVGGQIAWLGPACLVGAVVGLWCTRRAPRTDLRRASLVLWTGWVAVTALVFSFMSGIFHSYYTVALAPGVAALAGIGASLLWERRRHPAAPAAMAATVVASAVWSRTLLGRAPTWNPWLADAVLAGGLVAGAALAVGVAWRWLPSRLGPVRSLVRATVGAASVVGVAVVLAGPAAWSVATIGQDQTGSLFVAGPAGLGGGPGGLPGGVPVGGVPRPPLGVGGRPVFRPPGGLPAPFPAGPTRPTIGGGGLLDAPSVSDDVVELLEQDADRFDWVAATTGAQMGAGFQLASGEPVLAIGGFNGSDPAPTLEQFQELVADGRVHWYVTSGVTGMASMGGSDAARDIAAWVDASFEPVSVGGLTMYDLSGAVAGDVTI